MRHLFICVLLYFIITQIYSQETPESTAALSLKTSVLSIGGSSNSLIHNDQTFYISQSIGQSGVIGTSQKNGFSLRQGYQQPPQALKKDFNYSRLSASVYPNPFKEVINIVFNETIDSDIQISLYDILGKRLYLKTFKALQRLEISTLPNSNGTYFLNISANQKKFSTKLIKY